MGVKGRRVVLGIFIKVGGGIMDFNIAEVDMKVVDRRVRAVLCVSLGGVYEVRFWDCVMSDLYYIKRELAGSLNRLRVGGERSWECKDVEAVFSNVGVEELMVENVNLGDWFGSQYVVELGV
ncbi:hypothetical protein Tco_0348017 [Tanacetum coccineum]